MNCVGMSLPVTSRQKSIPRPARLESDVSLQDKRRLLSYWKSLEPPTTPDQEPDDKGSVTDALLEDFKKNLTEMEKCVSDVISSEIETNNLQSEQQSLLKQLRDYVQYLIKEKIVLDLNDNLNTGKDVNRDYQERFAAMEAERNSLLEENKKLVKQLETQSEEFKSSNQEQQRDIETLTRVCMSSRYFFIFFFCLSEYLFNYLHRGVSTFVELSVYRPVMFVRCSIILSVCLFDDVIEFGTLIKLVYSGKRFLSPRRGSNV